MELVRDELVGELAGEVHQMVGGDRAGDGDLHFGPRGREQGALRDETTGPKQRTGRPVQRDGLFSPPLGDSKAQEDAAVASLRSATAALSQWNESPHAQEFCAFGLSMVKP
ncbi:hypothetical protein GCM10009531_76030 [Actinoplanes capillaceus]